MNKKGLLNYCPNALKNLSSISSKGLLKIVHDTIPDVKKLAGTLNISSSPMIRKMMLAAKIPDEPTVGKETSPFCPKGSRRFEGVDTRRLARNANRQFRFI